MSKRRAILTVLCALVVVGAAAFAVAPTATADALLQSVRRIGNTFIVTSVGNAALDVDQRGSGSIANFSDGGTDEFTIDQSSSTTVNPLIINGSTDAYQLSIVAAPTQSTPPFVVKNSSGTPVASISNAGALSVQSMSGLSSVAVTAASNGALWTVPASQVWQVKRVMCKITTNFDCTGDDCTLIIGDGNDPDGFLVLADAELQTADTEGTGFPAGWQGLVAATIGAYLDPEQSFIYAATDTIDIKIEDASDNSDPTAGAATCYLDYSRWQ